MKETVLFVEPRKRQVVYKNPIQLQNLAGIVDKEVEADVSLLDLDISEDRKLVSSVNPDIVVISTPSCAINSIRYLIDLFLSRSKLILVGEIITDGLQFEFTNCLGVSESSLISIPSFKKDVLLHEIKKHIGNNNLSFSNKEIPFGKSLYEGKSDSALPFFTKSIIKEYEKNGFQLFINGITSGCEEKCTFCRLNNRKETSGVVEEINYNSNISVLSLLSKSSNKDLYIQFSDENFFGGKSLIEKNNRLKSIIKFSENIKKDIQNSKLKIGVDTRVDTILNVDDDILLRKLRLEAWRAFKDAGLKYVYIGVESVSKSQIKRYGKRFEPISILNSLELLKNLDVDFTIGLIMIDPLVSIDEIKENIFFIRKYELYQFVASPLKEMRVQVNSVYYRLLQKKYPQKNNIENYYSSTPASVIYQEPQLNKIIPIIRAISNLFRDSGYRHSDISRMFSLDKKGLLLIEIPSIIVKMELNILEYLIGVEIINYKFIDNLINDAIASIDLILVDARACKNTDLELLKYYEKVISLIKNKLPCTLELS